MLDVEKSLLPSSGKSWTINTSIWDGLQHKVKSCLKQWENHEGMQCLKNCDYFMQKLTKVRKHLKTMHTSLYVHVMWTSCLLVSMWSCLFYTKEWVKEWGCQTHVLSKENIFSCGFSDWTQISSPPLFRQQDTYCIDLSGFGKNQPPHGPKTCPSFFLLLRPLLSFPFCTSPLSFLLLEDTGHVNLIPSSSFFKQCTKVSAEAKLRSGWGPVFTWKTKQITSKMQW